MLQKTTEQLTDLIEEWNRDKEGLIFTDLERWPCEDTLADEDGKHIQCGIRKSAEHLQRPRKIDLFTFNDDYFSLVMKYWKFTRCNYENRYTEETDGIFIAARHRAFTVELLIFGCTNI